MTREHRILEMLAMRDCALYGLDLVASGVAKRSWLYFVLARMEDRGLIEGREDTRNPPRRLYRITDTGRGLLLPIAKVR